MKGPRTMFGKIWDAHVVAEGPGDQTLLFIDRHLLHEGATHAFDRLQAAGRTMRRPDLAVATADHYLPTTPPAAGVPDPEVRGMLASLARHTGERGIAYFGPGDPFRKQGLLTGQDEIALTLTHAPAIADFEARRRKDAPWLFAAPA